MQGKLIVIEGTDGSGKATQSELLVKRLKKDGHEVEYIDFPRYDNDASVFVRRYLNGEFGTAEDVEPMTASFFYALDRYDASFEIKKWLKHGKIVITNRYVSASKGHQGGKIKGEKARKEYLDWLDDLEYNKLGIPKEDAVLFLYVPCEIGQKLVGKKTERAYTKGKSHDIHEADIEHLKDAEEFYLWVANREKWIKIDCAKNKEIMKIEDIQELIWKKIKEII